MYNFRTDLAVERREIFKKANKIEDEIDGVETQEEKISDYLKSTKVKILNDKASQALGKPIGTYITIDIKNLKIATDEQIQEASELLSTELKKLIDEHTNKEDSILVVGLGNESVTPDALGPNVTKEIDVTRHILTYMPQYLEPGTRSVSAVAPGVLGTTGIETLEVLKGIVDNIHPKLVIVIDALASRSIERISSTIQISDTGIVPGAGVGNTRAEISEKTLNIPVLAIRNPYSSRTCDISIRWN